MDPIPLGTLDIAQVIFSTKSHLPVSHVNDKVTDSYLTERHAKVTKILPDKLLIASSKLSETGPVPYSCRVCRHGKKLVPILVVFLQADVFILFCAIPRVT